MRLSETIKIHMTGDHKNPTVDAVNKYINTVNSMVSNAVKGSSGSKHTSTDAKNNLPSALTIQSIRGAESIISISSKNVRQDSVSGRNEKPAKFKSAVTIDESRVPVIKSSCRCISSHSFKIRDG